MRVFKIMNVLIVCVVGLTLVACANSPVHPIVGKWELIRGALNLPKKLELEPSNKATADDRARGRYDFTSEGDLVLTFDTFSWQGKMDLSVSSLNISNATLKLSDASGNTNVYRKTGLCTSEMGPACAYDK